MIEETKIKTQELVHGILAIIERAHTQLGIAGAIKRKIIHVKNREEALAVFKEYEKDTFHFFPRKDLNKILKEVIYL